MTLVRYNPNRPLNHFENEFNRLIQGFWDRGEAAPESQTGFLPPLDIHETKDSYHVSVELPGLGQGDVKVTVVENSLVIRGEKKSHREETDANYHRLERRYGRFERILQLAAPVDKNRVAASLKDGVLLVSVPKAEEAREREVQIDVKS